MILAPPSNLFYPNHPITSSDMGCAISRASLSMVVLSPRGSFHGEFSSASAAAGGGSSRKNGSSRKGELGTGVVRKESVEAVDRKSPQFLKEQSVDGEYLDWKRVDSKSFKNSSNKTGDSWVRKEDIESVDQEQSVEGGYLDWKRVDCKSMKKDEREWENRVIWSHVEDDNRDDREDGIWVCPGSPSFRIYCVDNNDVLVHPRHQSITIEEDIEEEEEEKGNSPTNSMKEHNKGLGLGQAQAHRRWRIGKGFNGMKYLLNVISNPNSHRHHHHHNHHHVHHRHHHHNSNSLAIEQSVN